MATQANTSTSNCRLSGLSIRRPAGTEVANGLYANGRHQCEVIIDVVKETCGPDGVWGRSLLTEEERASVTVVSWSEHDNQTLTAGWRCDKERNEFVLGLWMDSPTEEFGCGQVVEHVDDARGESIRRYLRCAPDAPIGAEVFMACVVIEGGIYTSYGLSKGAGATVAISPVAPFELKASDLELYMDTQAYVAGATYRTEVHIYYWMPPAKIEFVRNFGFENPLNMPGEGEDFKSTLFFQNPLENRWSNIVGTCIHKDHPSARLYLDDIRPGLPAPSENPLCRFNERTTIMRAVRLKSIVTYKNSDTRSVWTLLDNYGTEQKFTLSPMNPEIPGFPFLILRGAIIQPPVYLLHFKVRLPVGEKFTDELYNNGRHQCKVVVEVAIEQLQPEGGWAPARLTQAQRDSVTITRFSANPHEPLPRGWSCDREKNKYDSGLWQGAASHDERDGNVLAEQQGSRNQMETVDRYMRVDSSVPIETIEFMASITLDGKTYTTNSAQGDIPFVSSVEIRARRSYRLWKKDLVLYHDIHAYTDNDYDIDVYYWTPPSGLRFVENLGLDNPYDPDSGPSFHTSYRISFRGAMKAGVLIRMDELNPRVVISNIDSRDPQGHLKLVRADRGQTIMRAVRFQAKKLSASTSNTLSVWRLWDNYGCEHMFKLGQADSGNVIDLLDA